jgi:hypothetical protein
MAHRDRSTRGLGVWGPLAALVLGTALGVSAVRAQDTGAKQGGGAPGDAKPADGQTSGKETVTTPGEKKSGIVANAKSAFDFLFIEFGFMDPIIAENEAEEDAERAEQWQRYNRTRQEMGTQGATPEGATPQGAGGESIRRFQPDPKADPQFATQSALEGMADRLEELGLKDLSRALRDLAHKIRLAPPQTAGPAPISLWIQGRPPGSGPNPGAELAFNVSHVGTFQAAGVALLSNTLSDPTRWPGAVYAEPDQPRKIAPAPALDPAGWPATGAVPLSLALETPIP